MPSSSFNRESLQGAVERRRTVENHHKRRNRAAKVRAYVAIIDVSFLTSGLNPDRHAQRIADYLESRDEQWWGRLAEQNTLNVASATTRDLIVAEYRQRARAVVWLSTLGLDSWPTERLEQLRVAVAHEIASAPASAADADWVAVHRQAERILRFEITARAARAAA